MKLKHILDFPGYALSRDGRVWSCLSNRGTLTNDWKERKVGLDPYGYPVVGLWRERKQVFKKVHRLMWDTYQGKLPAGMTVNHKDGDKCNNSLSNLECLSHADNMKHAWRTGLMKNRVSGEQHPKAKLTWVSVAEIRKLYSEGVSQHKLAKQFDTYSSNINDIVHFKTWKPS